MTDIPYWRLSAFYLFYFALVGCVLPYMSLYFQSEGFSAVEIGQLTGMMAFTRVIAPNLWAKVADYTGRPMAVLRFGAWFTPGIFAFILIFQGYWAMAFIVVSFNFFWSAILPQFEVVTLDALGDKSNQYSKIRLWGSIGFIVAVWGLGELFEVISVGQLPIIMLILMFAIACSTMTFKAKHHVVEETEDTTSILSRLFRPHLLGFLIACFLIQVSHGPYNTFFSIYLKELDYDEGIIGFLWAMGVIAEVLIFIKMHRILEKFSLSLLAIVSLLLTGLRWWMTAVMAEQLWALILIQCIHAFSFGVMHAVAIEWIRKEFPRKQQSQGQALYSSITFGAGSAIGAVASGYLWSWSGAESLFMIAALVSVLGAIVMILTEKLAPAPVK